MSEEQFLSQFLQDTAYKYRSSLKSIQTFQQVERKLIDSKIKSCFSRMAKLFCRQRYLQKFEQQTKDIVLQSECLQSQKIQPIPQVPKLNLGSSLQLHHKQHFTPDQALRLGSIKALNFSKAAKPQFHKNWKLLKVIVGHNGWVRSIAIDPNNQFFVTGSNDRTIKFWDMASHKLKLSLTGHINAIRDLVISNRHPYLFSCAEDKTIKCWDLQQNKVVRYYHGHLSGVYALALHPQLDLLFSGGRDASVRCWDIRLRAQVHCLDGHNHTVASLLAQQHQPQVISGSFDSTVRLWDIVAGKCAYVLTNHKKSIRSMVLHPRQFTFASGGTDNIKIWKCPQGQFLRNLSGHNAIINCLALNQDNVLVSGGYDGSLKFWDWSSGYNFQSQMSKPQPGSISAQSGVHCCRFDMSGLRLITGQCDKTIKIWGEQQ